MERKVFLHEIKNQNGSKALNGSFNKIGVMSSVFQRLFSTLEFHTPPVSYKNLYFLKGNDFESGEALCQETGPEGRKDIK